MKYIFRVIAILPVLIQECLMLTSLDKTVRISFFCNECIKAWSYLHMSAVILSSYGNVSKDGSSLNLGILPVEGAH